MHIIGQPVDNISFSMYQNDAIVKKSLADFRGSWIILFFYPADFTFICPTELEELATLYSEFKNASAEIISVSTDTVYVHKAWHDNSPAIKKVSFPMAADPTGALAKAFGTYIEHEGVSLRGTFIIDPTGVLRAYEVHDNSIGRSGKELLRKLKAAQYVQANPGSVCPASWEPGRDVLKPALDLVGKI